MFVEELARATVADRNRKAGRAAEIHLWRAAAAPNPRARAGRIRWRRFVRVTSLRRIRWMYPSRQPA
jgi:hypothetical protein